MNVIAATLCGYFPVGISSGFFICAFACNYRPEATAGAGSAFTVPLWTFVCSPAMICSQFDDSYRWRIQGLRVPLINVK